MKRTFITPVFLVLILAACGPSTKISKSWMDPSVSAATWKPFQKVLVLGLIKDDATRRITEDKLAAQFPGRAIQSYKYLSASDTTDEAVGAKLVKDGFDGVVYMRLANVEQSTSYVPGTTYGGFYGYRGYGYGMYGTQGYYQEDKTYNVETNIYSVQPPKLLWSGTTASVNPTKLSSTLDEIIMAVRDEFTKKGILKK
jgi:hypothetical protein